MRVAQPITRGGLIAAAFTITAAVSLCAQDPPVAAPPQSGQSPPPAEPRDPPSAGAIARWIGELDSDVFDTRENATLKLIEAGMPAVTPIKKVLQSSGSLEVTTRALHVLRELGMSTDLDVQDGARSALEELARDPTSIGRRASAAIAWLNEQRSSQTIDALEKLGAVINKSQYPTELGELEEIDGIQIDDGWRGTERDFRRLKWLQDVDKLVLVGDKIDDAIVPHVAAMPGLKRLHLYRTKISDRGMAAMGSIATLTEIGIYYSPLGDAAIEPLKGLKELSNVRLYGTKVSPAAQERLAAALGLKAIDYRQGAFLGVSCQPLGNQCQVATVHEGTPANKADIRPGDILLKFAGKKVADFEGLTAIISQYRAGEVVEVELLRPIVDENGNNSEKALTTKVTLGGWDVEFVQRQGRP